MAMCFGLVSVLVLVVLVASIMVLLLVLPPLPMPPLMLMLFPDERWACASLNEQPNCARLNEYRLGVGRCKRLGVGGFGSINDGVAIGFTASTSAAIDVVVISSMNSLQRRRRLKKAVKDLMEGRKDRFEVDDDDTRVQHYNAPLAERIKNSTLPIKMKMHSERFDGKAKPTLTSLVNKWKCKDCPIK
ncbi:hypothetical protein Q3G72_021527 [Acer saccharum]|nr:hypothetical protein Q3G72_021527 [Acer saccharum]